MKNRVTVEIFDKEYTLITDETEEYVRGLAARVTKLMSDMLYQNLRTVKADAAILTCLDLCDKLTKANETHDNMQRQIMNYIDDISALSKKLARYERQKNKGGEFETGEPAEDDAAPLLRLDK